jgi:hypothetical protein
MDWFERALSAFVWILFTFALFCVAMCIRTIWIYRGELW